MGRQRDATFYDGTYSRQPRRARQITHERHQEIAKWIVGDSVLDLGCGVALIANMIGQRDYLGIDFSAEAIASCHKVSTNKNATFVIGSVFDETILPNRTYDTVLAIEVLEHLDNPEELVQLALAHCEKRLIVTVPVDMRGPAHVRPTWEREDITSLVGPTKALYQFGGDDADYWWLAVKDVN